MSLVLSTAGKKALLDWALAGVSTPDLTLKLFGNDYTPPSSGVFVGANFTEATFTGYSAKTLHPTDCTTSSATDGTGVAVYPVQSWTNSGTSQTIYGAYVCHGSDVLWAERYPLTRVVGAGEICQYRPQLTSGTAV